MKFSIKDFFSLYADLVTFTKEIINEKLHFLCSEGENCGIVTICKRNP